MRLQAPMVKKLMGVVYLKSTLHINKAFCNLNQKGYILQLIIFYHKTNLKFFFNFISFQLEIYY